MVQSNYFRDCKNISQIYMKAVTFMLNIVFRKIYSNDLRFQTRKTTPKIYKNLTTPHLEPTDLKVWKYKKKWNIT